MLGVLERFAIVVFLTARFAAGLALQSNPTPPVETHEGESIGRTSTLEALTRKEAQGSRIPLVGRGMNTQTGPSFLGTSLTDY